MNRQVCISVDDMLSLVNYEINYNDTRRLLRNIPGDLLHVERKTINNLRVNKIYFRKFYGQIIEVSITYEKSTGNI